jgi:hypothetical protein
LAHRLLTARIVPTAAFVIGTREDSQIALVAKPMFGGLSLSADGKYLIYSQKREASNLMLVEDFLNGTAANCGAPRA